MHHEKGKRAKGTKGKRVKYTFEMDVEEMYVFVRQNIKNNKGEGRGNGAQNDMVQTPLSEKNKKIEI